MLKRYTCLLAFVLVFGVNASLGQTKKVILKVEETRKRAAKPSSGSQNKGVSRSKEKSKSSAQKREKVIQGIIGNMVPVEAGTFTMGATPEQGEYSGNDEKPAHKVMVSPFSIGRYEVTQEEWLAVMGSNPSHFKGDKRPVEQVSWRDCQKFIEKLNALTGRQFRLPTEAEWEYAARGGSVGMGNMYAGGTNADAVGWYNENSDGETHEVGKKRANELGLYDMAGNVWEWCSDHKQNYANSAEPSDSQEPSTTRVNRGGSWRSGSRLCRVSFRADDDADERLNTLGFRLAM